MTSNAFLCVKTISSLWAIELNRNNQNLKNVYRSLEAMFTHRHGGDMNLVTPHIWSPYHVASLILSCYRMKITKTATLQLIKSYSIPNVLYGFLHTKKHFHDAIPQKERWVYVKRSHIWGAPFTKSFYERVPVVNLKRST